MQPLARAGIVASLVGGLGAALIRDGVRVRAFVNFGAAVLGCIGIFAVICGVFTVKEARRDPACTTADWRFRQYCCAFTWFAGGGGAIVLAVALSRVITR